MFNVLSQYKTRRVAECFICDKTRNYEFINLIKQLQKRLS
jgi:hypothetical protein